jgi:outer membrane protein
MRKVLLLLLSFTAIHIDSRAQAGKSMDDAWSLQRCVQYAIDHNISIKQDSITARLAGYTLQQSKLAQLPSLSASGSYGKNFGRSINPTTNQFVDANYNSANLSGNGSLLLFGWNQMRNSVAKNRYSLSASLADLEQLKDDVSLNVATGFLTALLAQEQINVSKNQVGLSKAQLDQTRAFAEAGRLPELNVAQLESQLATDSSNLINAIANYNSAVLDLKSLLNLDMSAPFTIQIPDVDVANGMLGALPYPEDVYNKARTHFGSIKGSEYRVQAAEKGLAAAKAGLYPALSLGYQIGTSFASNYFSYQPTTQLEGYSPVGITGRSQDTVYQPVYKTLTPVIPFGTQINNNLRQTVYLNLNIPIFNGWQAQYGIRQARLNLEQQRQAEKNVENTLKQNVYKAHNSALSSMQKYNAALRAEQAATRALEFAKKRYELGLTSTVDLLVTQNSQFAAASNLISAKYDLIFKLKVLDYYLGKELKL